MRTLLYVLMFMMLFPGFHKFKMQMKPTPQVQAQVICPSCGESINDGIDICPFCNNYIQDIR